LIDCRDWKENSVEVQAFVKRLVEVDYVSTDLSHGITQGAQTSIVELIIRTAFPDSWSMSTEIVCQAAPGYGRFRVDGNETSQTIEAKLGMVSL
jgi:hypothetical protein